MILIYVIVILNQFFYSQSDGGEIKACQEKLDKVLTFILNKYYDINFDGLFGVILAQAQLMKITQFNISTATRNYVEYFIDKSQLIKLKIFPLLSNYPSYMNIFKSKLLNEFRWAQVLESNFTMNKIKHLPYYNNWTTETILNNKIAAYKGIKTDTCIQEILFQSKPKLCYVSPICHEMMLDKSRMDTGYLLTHRVLYLLIAKFQQCIISDQENFIKYLCSYIYKEAKTNEHLGYPYHDIFLEQVILCGMEGIEEFLKEKWLIKILEWQNPHGCYESIAKVKSKRTSNIIDFGCSDHSTGLGAAAISLYLRYQLTKIHENVLNY